MTTAFAPSIQKPEMNCGWRSCHVEEMPTRLLTAEGMASSVLQSSPQILLWCSHCRELRRHFVGLPSAEDPANTLRPSASLTLFAFAIFAPSFARYPSTVTWSPSLSESCFQPSRLRNKG